MRTSVDRGPLGLSSDRAAANDCALSGWLALLGHQPSDSDSSAAGTLVAALIAAHPLISAEGVSARHQPLSRANRAIDRFGLLDAVQVRAALRESVVDQLWRVVEVDRLRARLRQYDDAGVVAVQPDLNV